MNFSDNLDWITEALSRDTQAITRALHYSLSNTTHAPSPSPTPTPTPTTSSVHSPGFSGSDPDTTVPPPKHRNSVANGKITKRKSRASKRPTTTIITADPADFRRLVQQVTGFGFGKVQVPVLKPEPKRPYNRLQGCLPTLDTSAFMFDHRQQQVVGPASTGPVMSYAAPVMEADGGLNYETSLNFPTLESWKVM